MPPRAPEAEVLLLCACQRLAGPGADRVAELCRAANFRWRELYRAAVAHKIAALVLTNLLRIGAVAENMPPAIKRRWQNFNVRNILAKKNQARVVRQIIEFFRSRSIRVMLIKGVALDAVVYEEPWYIQSDDADLLVDTPYRVLGKADMVALGALLKGGCSVELDFARHHDLDMNMLLDIDYSRLWAEARTINMGAYIMGPEDMVLATCINLCRKRYQQLKAIVALRELIAAYPSLDWQHFARNAKACGADRIVYAALTIAAHVFGCTVPAPALAELHFGRSRRWAIQRLTQSISASLVPIPQPSREPAGRRVASGLLRIASYRISHFFREFRAHRDLRRFRAHSAAMASAT